MNARANTAIDLKEAVSELLGKHPNDVLATVKSCDDALSWIAEILSAATRERDNKNLHSAWRLIEAAQYLASDFSNYASCEHEEMRNSLSKYAGTAEEAHA